MKKSIVISLLIALCILCTAVYSFASTGIVTTDTLRLRKDASVEASILALLSMDDKVEILEEKNGWYKVKSGNMEGYVSADYIDVQEEVPENNEEQEEETDTKENKKMIKVIQNGVNVYITPIINSLVLNTTSEEVQVEIISEVKGWSYITAKNIKGWVRTENIIEKEASETEKNNNNSSQKTGYISASSVNFREEANTSSEIISGLTKNTEVKILGEENGWYKIEYKGTIGYVSKTYVSNKKVETTSRSSNSLRNTPVTTTRPQETVNQEVAPSENVQEVAQSVNNQEVNTVQQTNQNVESTETNQKEEVNNTEVVKVEQEQEKEKDAEVVEVNKGAEIVAFAKKYLGYKYVYGGSSPSGFDCSGFVQYVYKSMGYSVSRTATAQSTNGVAVSSSNLSEGDIICFAGSSGSKSISHSGIYIGGGKFIHAANSRKGVIISNVHGDGFYFVCARRIIK